MHQHRRVRWTYALIVLAGLFATVTPIFARAPRAVAAPPAFVQEVARRVTGGTSNAVSFPGPNRAGDLVVVYVLWSNNGGVSVTDSNGNTYLPAGSATSWNGGRARAAVFYAANVAAGANIVTATFASPITTFGLVHVHEYTNVAPTAVLDGTTVATGSGTTVSSDPLTTTTNGDLVMAVGASTNAVRLTEPGYTIRSSQWHTVTADASGLPAGTHTVTGTQNGRAWVLQLVAFRPGSGGTTPTTTPTTTTTTSTTSTTAPPSATTTTTTSTTTPPTTTAPPAFVQEVASRVTGGTSNAVSFPGPNRAGDLIVVYVLWSNPGGVSVTDSNGNSYVPAGVVTSWNGGQARAAVFYAANVAAGANIVTATFASPITTFGIVYAHEYTNVATTAVLDGTTVATGSGTTVSSDPLTTTTNGDLLMAVGASTDALRITEPGYTIRSSQWDNVTADASGLPAGAHTVTGTQNGRAWVVQVLAFKAGSGGSTPPTTTPTTTTTTTTTTTSTTAPPSATTTTTTAPTPPPSGSIGPLRQSSVNPRYFVDPSGKAVLLTGSHTWNTLQDWGTGGAVNPIDFDAFVAMLVANKHNFTFLWTVELPHFCNLPTHVGSSPEFDVSPMPWQRVGPGLATDGKPKFDLNRFDQAYFDRLRQRVAKLNAAGIYVGVYPFTGEWLNVFRCANDGFPLDGANNINGVNAGAGVSAIGMTAPNAVTAVQDRFVEKMVDTLNDLPNVVWATSEEAPTESWWNNHQIEHIRAYEATKPFQHPIGYGAPLSGDGGLLASKADWVAPATRISSLTNCGSGTPSCKVVINDSDHSYFGLWNDTERAYRSYIWGNFTHGSQVAFMDPYRLYYPREGRNDCPSPVRGICPAPNARYDNLRANLGYTRQYADRMNLVRMTPQPSVASTGNALATFATNETEVLVYAPAAGSFTVNLAGTRATLRVEWLDPATGAVTVAPSVTGGSGVQTFTAPFSGDAVLYLSDVVLRR